MAASAFGKKEEVYGFRTLYREIGYYISKLEQYERALKFFDEAIKKTPDDRRALMGRAWARSKACYYEGALEDIRKALKLDPDDLVMLAHKALNTYLNCEFEDGLVQNTRLIPKRKKPDYFSMGAMHCADAIENCLGDRAGRPLRDHYQIIRKLAWKKNFESQKEFQPKARFRRKKKKTIVEVAKVSGFDPSNAPPKCTTDEEPSCEEQAPENEDRKSEESLIDTIYSMKSERNVLPPAIYFPFKPLQRYSSNIQNFMAEKYLDTLYKDKLFLKNLAKEPGVHCPNQEGTKKILQLAKTGYKTVKYKQELLRARRPFYFIKYQEATSSGALKIRQEQEMKRLQKTTKKDADELVKRLNDALKGKKHRLVLEISEKLKTYCDSRSKKLFPERKRYLSIVYDSVCRAHFDLKRLKKNQENWQQRISTLLGIPVSREPSTDSVIQEFKGVFIDWRKQIELYGDRLRKATSPEEVAWIYHELARFNIELKQYELGRVYARKCLNEAQKLGDNRWAINALMLIMKINIGQNSKNDAKTDAQRGVNLAKTMKNPDIVEFMQKCLEVIERIDLDEKMGSKVLQAREQKIINMMAEDKMKEEAAHLFRMMAAMPASRRMSVMPGVRIEEETTPSGKKKKASKRQSIMPAQKTGEFEFAQPKKEKGPNESGQGVGFLDLIQYHIED